MSKLTKEYIKSKGFRQLGRKWVYSNSKYQLHLVGDSYWVYKKQDNGVLYSSTNITVSSTEELLKLLNNNE